MSRSWILVLLFVCCCFIPSCLQSKPLPANWPLPSGIIPSKATILISDDRGDSWNVGFRYTGDAAKYIAEVEQLLAEQEYRLADGDYLGKPGLDKEYISKNGIYTVLFQSDEEGSYMIGVLQNENPQRSEWESASPIETQ